MTDLPMFERASRRAVLKRTLAAGGVLAAVGALAGCGNDDASAFSTTHDTAQRDTTTSTAGTTRSTAGATSTAPATTGAAAASGTATSLAFTYTAADQGGRVRNPYIAAWVEDSSSTMVGLISVWYSTRDAKYLRELTEFTAAATNVDQAQLDAVSGATRTAGSVALTWDGTGLDGAVLTGPHTIWVEAAREHGPHSVTNGPVTLGQPGATTIPGSGELSDVTVTIG